LYSSANSNCTGEGVNKTTYDDKQNNDGVISISKSNIFVNNYCGDNSENGKNVVNEREERNTVENGDYFEKKRKAVADVDKESLRFISGKENVQKKKGSKKYSKNCDSKEEESSSEINEKDIDTDSKCLAL
jgi:hypothetical protein